MATSTKAKAKRKKTVVTKKARSKKAVRKTSTIAKKAAKKAPPRRVARTKAKPTARAGNERRPVSQPARPQVVKSVPSSAAQPAAADEKIGVVTHYYSHPSVAVVRLEPDTRLRVGDIIQVRGHSTDFRQTVESLEVNHTAVTEVGPGDDFGLKLVRHAREHDVVYRVRS